MPCADATGASPVMVAAHVMVAVPRQRLQQIENVAEMPHRLRIPGPRTPSHTSGTVMRLAGSGVSMRDSRSFAAGLALGMGLVMPEWMRGYLSTSSAEESDT